MLIAVVGQNEAGKTSFLEALREFNSHEEIEERDQTRRLDITTEVMATFELEEDDRNALSHIDGGEKIEQCTLTKRENGEITASLDPKPPHDLEPRKSVRSELEPFIESKVFDEKISAGVKRDIKRIIDVLNTEKDHLSQLERNMIQEPASKLGNIIEKVDSDTYDTETIEKIKDSLETLEEHERESPPQQARDLLPQRCPQFLIFDEDCRDLKRTYDLKEEVPNPSKALANLAELADLNLQQLQDAVVSENIALRDDLKEEANEELKREFSKAWVKSEVVPVLSVDGTILHINVRTPDEENRAPIDQRSDGLRWFIALVAFLNQKDVTRPILLVDEAESHLSYDAQAELVEVLETQEFAQKVIYTTHSAGCLPSDLGRGIRPVIQKEGERSDIRNGFWEEGPGFKPIMGAMGLGPLAFSVARNAMIAEGPSETILLPTLIRQATEKLELEYQVAPGASNVGDDKLPELLSETGRSVILLDGDDGGEETKDTLIEAEVDPEKVRTYVDFVEEPLVFEDLIDPEKYAKAINEELQTFQDPENEMDASQLSKVNRVEDVKEWCRNQDLDSPVKPNICQRLVEEATKGANVLDSDREHILREVHDWAKEHFVLTER